MEGSVLKIDIWSEDDIIEVKSFDMRRNCFVCEFELEIEMSDASSLLGAIKQCILDAPCSVQKVFGKYSIDITVSHGGQLELSVWELNGQKSRHLGCYVYSKYMGGISLLAGLTLCISRLRSYY